MAAATVSRSPCTTRVTLLESMGKSKRHERSSALLTTRSIAKCLAAEKKLSAAVRAAVGCGLTRRRRSAFRVLRSQEAHRDRSAHARHSLPVLFEHDDRRHGGCQGGENVKVLDIAELLLSRRTLGSPERILSGSATKTAANI